MAFDPIQEDCHRLVLEALRRDNIPLTDGAAVERLMEQFTRNPAPLIVHAPISTSSVRSSRKTELQWPVRPDDTDR